MKDQFYADYDENSQLYCVFGTETGKAYSSYASQEEAEEDAKKRNRGTEEPLVQYDVLVEVVGNVMVKVKAGSYDDAVDKALSKLQSPKKGQVIIPKEGFIDGTVKEINSQTTEELQKLGLY